MKKGFTLVELLAVIVILAVILVIAVPLVLKVVDNSRINAYLKNEQMVLKAVDLYASRNTGVLPGEVGSTTEVSINYLVSNGMLTEITNPYNKSEDCTGYVTIMKLSERKYDYTPHLKCGLDIHDSGDDGLVAHYKFNDFQEPTENEISNVGYLSWLEDLSIGEFSDRSTSRDGITTVMRFTRLGENRFKAEVLEGGYYFIYSITGHGYDWNDGGSLSANIVEYHLVDDSSNFGLGRSCCGTGSLHGGSGTGHKEAFISGVDSTSHRITIRNGNSWTRPGSYIVWENLQLERKAYATPYTSGMREGVVKDYSGNHNHAPLELETTPRWVYDKNRKGGVYDLNGQNVRVDSYNNVQIYGNAPRTIVGWINTRNGSSGTTKFTVMASHGVANSGNDFSLGVKENKVSVGYWGAYTDGTTSISNNVWYHIAATYDGTTTRVYLNGDLDGEQNRSINTPDGTIKIGNRANDVHTFNGLIDDVRIYNRALSEQEIKLLYESTK